MILNHLLNGLCRPLLKWGGLGELFWLIFMTFLEEGGGPPGTRKLHRTRQETWTAMLVVRDTMLAEGRNSRESSGLPRKIGRGEERERKKEVAGRKRGSSEDFLGEKSFIRRRYGHFLVHFFLPYCLFMCFFFCLLNFHPLFGNACYANILFSWASFKIIVCTGLHGLV